MTAPITRPSPIFGWRPTINCCSQPVAIAPYVAYVLPTHNYETLGHAAPGRGLDETWVGVAVGKTLDQWIPRTYVYARFTYAFVQAVQGISHDKENVEVELGYFFTPYLSVQGFWHWQQTLGGIELSDRADEPAVSVSRSTRPG